MLKDALKAFLELKENEAILSAEGGKKASKLTIGRLLYAAQDYLVAFGLGSIVVWMSAKGCSIILIFLATFVIDVTFAYYFIHFSDSSGYDITLGKSLRRVADVIMKNGVAGKIIGVVLLVWTCGKAIVWEGPETICTLFRKELNTRVKFHVAMIALSFGQAIFGTWLYTTGYKIWERFAISKLESYQLILLAIAIFAVFTLSVMILKKLGQWMMTAILSFWEASSKEKMLVVMGLLVIIAIATCILSDLMAKEIM